MIHEVTKALWLRTPKGLALCHFIIDYGIESDIYYVCAQQNTGEMWTWSNRDVRVDKNITLGREYISPFYDPKDVAFLKQETTYCAECRAHKCVCSDRIESREEMATALEKLYCQNNGMFKQCQCERCEKVNVLLDKL